MRVVRLGWPFKSKPVVTSSQTLSSPLQVFSAALVMAVVAALAAAISYSALYAGKIYPGVSIADMDFGGRTEDSARGILEARTEEYGNSKLVLRYQDRQWSTTPFEFGLRVDVDQTVDRGYRVGREGGLLETLGRSILVRARGYQSVPVFSFDAQAQRRVLERIASEIARSPVDAEVEVADSGEVRLRLPSAGLALDVDATIRHIEQSFEIYETHEVNLVVVEVPARVTEADLSEAKSLAEEILSKPLTATYGDRSWVLTPTDLAKMLVFHPVSDPEGKVGVKLDDARLLDFLRTIATQVDTEPREATIRYQEGRLVITDAEEGKTVDLDASAAAINRELALGNHTVPLAVKSTRPAISEEDLGAVKIVAQTIIGEPIDMRHGGDTWTLSRARLGDMLVFSRVEIDGRPSIVAGLDQEALTEFVEGIARQVDKRARDARFRFADGKLSLSEPEIDGLTVNVEETVELINAMVTTSRRQAALPVTIEKARVKASDLDNIVIKDLLTSASTSYAGAIPQKAHNIQLATGRLNGVVVPPGEVFSMNASLGPATLASGFQVGYGITLSGSNMATVPSVAGGICQVATTLYHAAFWAGLKIEQRLPHMYWIPRYGQPPKGMKGLDATVDDPWVDLKFRNNTGNWIAIQGYTSDSSVYFSIYGINPGWKVTAEGPFISNVVQPDTTIVEQVDSSLPEGKSLWIEQAEPGFDSTIIRHVHDKDGSEIDRYVVNSHYRPSRNVVLVSPKRQAAPTPTPTISGTPAPQPTPSLMGSPTPVPTIDSTQAPQPTSFPNVLTILELARRCGTE